MTSLRQIDANRRNAVKSTGPKTTAGKVRSRRNAIRHGLCAETIVDRVEDSDDYKEFEAAIIADYDAETVVERELVLRVASLFWRLRRVTIIETELFNIQVEALEAAKIKGRNGSDISINAQTASARMTSSDTMQLEYLRLDDQTADQSQNASTASARILAICFQQIQSDNGAFERLARYETALFRQLMRSIHILDSIRRRRRPSNRWVHKSYIAANPIRSDDFEEL